MAGPRAASILLTAITAAALLGAGALAARWPDVDPIQLVLVAVLVCPAAVVGLLIALRRPDNAVGPLMSLLAAVFAASLGFQDAYDEVVRTHPGALPVSDLDVALGQGSWMLLYLPAAFLMLVFPTGRLLGPRWRWVGAGLLVVPALFILVAASDPGPYPPPYQDVAHPFGSAPRWLGAVGVALLPTFLLLLVASAASMIVRYRRSTDAVLRAQVRWLALGAWSLPATLLLCWLSYLLIGRADLVVVGLGFTVVAIPAATAVAVLRHDLYDVDRALSATVTYAALSTCLLLVFTAGEAVAGVVLGRDSATAAAVATALAALALAPMRRRVQRVVDRRLYPLRDRVLSALSELRSGIDAGTASPEQLEPVLRTALRAPRLRVGYVLPGQDSPVDDRGRAVVGTVPVLLSGTTIGTIEPGPTPARKELLRETAAASAVFVEIARLRIGLTRALAEVSDSRGRILRHGYEERHKLQRDLHDGAQQRLVSLGMALRLAQRHLSRSGTDGGAMDRGAMDGVLDHAVAQLGTAVAELRTIAEGLRPPSLDGGLGQAMRSLAASVPIAVEVSVADDDVPDDVATTAYYVVSEGLANAVKHADAGRVGVSVARRDGHLTVQIRDDGIGGACCTGSGLAGLADRVAAAGGLLRVDSPAGAGTSVEAVLPCGS